MFSASKNGKLHSVACAVARSFVASRNCGHAIAVATQSNCKSVAIVLPACVSLVLDKLDLESLRVAIKTGHIEENKFVCFYSNTWQQIA